MSITEETLLAILTEREPEFRRLLAKEPKWCPKAGQSGFTTDSVFQRAKLQDYMNLPDGHETWVHPDLLKRDRVGPWLDGIRNRVSQFVNLDDLNTGPGNQAVRRKVWHESDGVAVAERWIDGADRCYRRKARTKAKPMLLVGVGGCHFEVQSEERALHAAKCLSAVRSLSKHFQVILVTVKNMWNVKRCRDRDGWAVVWYEDDPEQYEDFVLLQATTMLVRGLEISDQDSTTVALPNSTLFLSNNWPKSVEQTIEDGLKQLGFK